MYAGTAEGELLPTYVFYKSEHLWDTWTENGPEGTRYNRSKSGWFDSVCFEDWFFSVVVPFCRNKDGAKVLIGDNLSSHFSRTVLQKCEQLNIVFMCLPANATHILQPLNVAFYAPLKKYWREILTEWKRTDGRRASVLSKDAFPKLLKKLANKLNSSERGKQNLIGGFAKTGLYPLDPKRPLERLPRTDNDGNNINNVVSEAVLEMLTDMRGSSEPNEPKRRRKKVQVEPGKSISACDVLDQPSTSGLVKNKNKSKRESSSSESSSSESSSSESSSSESSSSNSSSSDSSSSNDDSHPLIKSSGDISPPIMDNTDDTHNQNFNEPGDNEKSIIKFKINDWILVKYSNYKSELHYVGRITNISTSATQNSYHVEFLKRKQSLLKEFTFTETDPNDTDDISDDLIVKKLKSPKIIGSGSRKFLKFTENFSKYNMD